AALPPGDDARAVATEGCADVSGPGQSLELVFDSGIPHARRPVTAPRDDGPPVRAERGSRHAVRVARQDCQLLAVVNVVDPRRAVRASGDEEAAVPAERDALDEPDRSDQEQEPRAGRDVPDARRPVFARGRTTLHVRA